MNNFHKLWEELNKQEKEEFIDESDFNAFQSYLSEPSTVLMEMANVRGMDVKVDSYLPFSFHFCSKDAVHQQHGIRAKIIWNPSKAPYSADGYMELHGNYDYIVGSHKYKPSEKEIKIARDFFKKYKVLFAAVWENVLYDGDLQDYFRGRIDFKQLLTLFNLKGKNYYNVNHCKTIKELETCICKNKIFNMND